MFAFNWGQNQQALSGTYTGKNINATDGSRTAIATDLVVGAVLIVDPYSFETTNNGGCFTRPQTNFLHLPKYVVVEVPQGSVRGGPIRVVPLNQDFFGTVMCNANFAVGDVGAITDGSWSLVAQSVFAATNLATTKTFGAKAGILAEAKDTSGTAALTRVMGIQL